MDDFKMGCCMRYWIFSLLIGFSLAAQTTTSTVAATTGSTAVFSIDPMLRGADLLTMFSALSKAPYKTAQSQLALQTTQSGLILNVQSLTAATYSTLLIVAYKPANVTQYTVVPVEQITELIYSPVAISPSSVFSSLTAPSGNFPYFAVDVSERASDIQNVVTTLITSSPYKTPVSTVSIQTTLSGPFYLSFSNGLIPDVKSVLLTSATNKTLLLINYKVGFQTTSIVVAPDQIYGIVYSSSG